jgi:hypothetical protein
MLIYEFKLQIRTNFRPSASVPRPPSRDSNEEREMDSDDHNNYIDQDIPAGQFPTAQSGPIAQFLKVNDVMPAWDWMNMTPEEPP